MADSVGIKTQLVFERASQTLTLEARQGRPSSNGTVSLYDTRYARSNTDKNPIVTGTATRTAISTTVTAASGPSESNPKRITCTPPAATKAGDFLLLTDIVNASEAPERIRVAGVGATYIDSAYDLGREYSTGALIESAVMTSPAVPTAWVENETNLGEDYEAAWTYTVGGVTYVETTYWDLVRYVYESSVKTLDVLDRYPDLSRFKFASSPEDGFAPVIRAAQRDVDALIYGMGLNPHRMRGNEFLKYVVLIRTAMLIADNDIKPPGRTTPPEFYQRRKEEWDETCTRILEGKVKLPYDDDNDGVIDDDDRNASSIDLIR